ncbi:putative transmembrane protein [Gregarina niphandrodes]|uniref:Transmembrane protein n=1 Tax=Gregarina niphandrodes TaxID=110365 RepID=A0A023B2C5_GRENI|nr:putative transmembrane protein [Gregarina niphandrodes]EZG51590.1 putative transmembrane protein [Gregarina niphandrodes]|eukprot:XP_011131950.1 putative transmembrane protein [Gregarina niphandrodes]
MLRRQPFLQQRPALLAALLAAATAWSGAIAPALEALLQLVTIVFAKAAIVLLTALYLLVSLGHKCWWGRRLILSPSPEWTTTTSADPLRPRVRLADVSPELAAQLAAQISARHAQAPNSRQSLAETHGHNVATLLRHALNPGVQGQEIPNRVTHDRMTPDRMTPDRMTPDRVQAWLESPETFSEHLARLLSVRNKVETLVDRAHYADPAVIQNQLRSIMRALTPTTRILHTFYQVASSDTEPHRVVQIMKRLRRKHLTI